MLMKLLYAARSAIVSGLNRAWVGLVSDRGRPGAFFRGRLAEPLLFRDAMAALNAVVVSDLKYRPKDRLAWKAWSEERDRRFLEGLAVKNAKAKGRMEQLHARLAVLDGHRRQRMAPFDAARRRLFEHVWQNEYELRLLLDPVITVHPDEVSFEAFSRDESTYARLSAGNAMFEEAGTRGLGTTNIDFSPRLHAEMQRLRTYRRTELAIGSEGFSASADAGGDDPVARAAASGGAGPVFEKKIDLPDSWVRGFLQVHSAMTLGLTSFRMQAADLLAICRHLRTHRARTSPRSLRYELVPGRPARVVLEPWNAAFEMGPDSVFEGAKPITVRTWGRDRLLVLARLLPVAKSITVHLAGMGLPSFYVADLGAASFTLGLSGWTDNDWTAGEGKFHLLSRPMSVSTAELTTAYDALKDARFGAEAYFAMRTGLGLDKTRSALSHLCQVGRAMYDLAGGVYRFRELFDEPFTPTAAAAALAPVEPALPASAKPFQPGAEPVPVSGSPATAEPVSPETAAQAMHLSGGIRIIARRPVGEGGFKLSGSASDGDGPRVRPLLHLDGHGKIVDASCTCRHFAKHRLTTGPCEHVLALRLAHMDRLEQEGA